MQKGVQRGTALGFPTANISLRGADLSGVFVARVRVANDMYAAAVFADKTRDVLEAYILDAEPNLYDKEIGVEILEKIREREDFSSETLLKAAIAADVEHVRAYFKTR